MPADYMPEPTADSEPDPAMTQEPQHFPEANFIPEPIAESDKVIEEILVEFNGMDWSSTHTLVAEGRLMS